MLRLLCSTLGQTHPSSLVALCNLVNLGLMVAEAPARRPAAEGDEGNGNTKEEGARSPGLGGNRLR